jgi:hypothetical protein
LQRTLAREVAGHTLVVVEKVEQILAVVGKADEYRRLVEV